jgi:YVTN family beta-propeller protein
MSTDLLARCCRAALVTVPVLAFAAPSSAQVFGYITDNLDRTVSVIDTTTDTVVATIDVGFPYPFGVACHPDGAGVYVGRTGAANVGTIILIDVATQTVDDSVEVGKYPRGLAVLPDGSRLYVANSTDDTVSRLSTPPPSRSQARSRSMKTWSRTGWWRIRTVRQSTFRTTWDRACP